MSFATMKKTRKKSLNRLVEESGKLKDSGGWSDTTKNYWKLNVDKAQNGSAVLRFLPPPEGEDVPWVRIFSHGFKDVGGWFIENCPTTLNEDCPVCKRNSELWAQGENSQGRKTVSGHGKEQGSKRKLAYISNVYVVKDTADPENEGKVFLFRYGAKIFEKLNDAMNPTFEDEEALNPFDLWEGATFRLKARKVDGYRNYDKSTFDVSGPLFENDKNDKLAEEVYKAEFPLAPMIAKSEFKTYAELENRLSHVVGNVTKPTLAVDNDDTEEAPVSKETKIPKVETAESVDLDDEADTMAFFDQIAKDD